MPTQSLKINFTSPLIQFDGRWGVFKDKYADYLSARPTVHLRPGKLFSDPAVHWSEHHCLGQPRMQQPGRTQLDNDALSPQPVSPGSNQFNITTSPTSDQGPHNLTLVSSETNFGVSHSFHLSSTFTSLNSSKITNDAPAFVYEPPDAWSTGGNGRVTAQKNAKATFSFNDDRVELYGTVGVAGGSYTAQLDEELSLHLTEQNIFLHVPTADNLIFYAAGLAEGSHTVTLISTSSGEFTVDYAIVDGDANPNSDSASPASSPTAPSPSPSSNTSSSVNATPLGHQSGLSKEGLIGLIAGIAASVTLLILALVYIICLRRRRNKRKMATASVDSFDELPPPQPGRASPEPDTTPRTPFLFDSEPIDRAPSFYSQSSATLDESEGYQGQSYIKEKAQWYGRDSRYSRDSLAVGSTERRQSVDQDVDNSKEVYAM
ncbi:hypothetical protein K438DRAFT_1747064 [Mycena galopus ATCC 62051]|nr:hypothetical protein K438DRAFT_1747064 [Mycena galopus ATCC 62051]